MSVRRIMSDSSARSVQRHVLLDLRFHVARKAHTLSLTNLGRIRIDFCPNRLQGQACFAARLTQHTNRLRPANTPSHGNVLNSTIK